MVNGPAVFSKEISSGKTLRNCLGILIAVWTLLLGVSLWLWLEHTYTQAEELSRVQARTALLKDEAYRTWAARLGGVYAPITKETRPNPYLDVKDRDVTTPTLQLTKINPEYMVRLVHELEALGRRMEVIGHLAGNDPLRAANKSDEWERAALEVMAKDRAVTEVSTRALLNGEDYLRLMHPAIANSVCGNCHAGVQPGDLVGGQSVSVLMAPVLAVADDRARICILAHAGIWVAGIILFVFGAGILQRNCRRQAEQGRELRSLVEDLQARLQAASREAGQKEQSLSAFMDNTEAGVFFKDSAGAYVQVNARFASLLNRNAAEFVGAQNGAMLPADLAARFAVKEKAVVDSRMPVVMEDLRLAHKPDELFKVVMFPLWGEQGDVAGVGGMVINTTQLKRMEEVISKAMLDAENASQANSDFFANISHEIRTPLNGIVGMADLLLRSDLDREQSSMVATIKSSSDNLLDVFNDIFDFSKIENGKMYIDPTPFSLRDMIFDAVANIVPRAYTKNLEVIVHVAPKVPDHLIGDWTRLRQVLLNLIKNAVKFTEAGEVTIAVRMLGQSAETVKLRLSVTDTGIGIDPENQKRIFEAFMQGDTSSTRKYNGVGLGLPIASALLKLMGSEMCLESSLGYGSSFWFDLDLPFVADDAAPRPMGSVQDLNGITVLVVDDNPTNLHILKEQLQTWGVVVQVCESAQEALQLLRLSINKGEAFNMVLTDLQMPVMDGLGLLSAMRDDLELKNIPGIILSSGEIPPTALADPVFSSSLSKPVRPEDLMRAMAAALGIWEKFDMSSFQVKVFRQGKNTYETRLRILLVEDMEVNQMVGVAMLSALGHEVTVARDGREALNMLKTANYDVVFMDIQMPVMDGLQATQLIRADPFLQRMPIVAMTAHALKGDKEKYLSQDMDAYIAKPMAMNELINVLNGIVVKFELGNPLLPDEADFSDDMATVAGTVILNPVLAVKKTEDAVMAQLSSEAGKTPRENTEPGVDAAAGPAPAAPAGEITETMLDEEAMAKVFAGHAKLILQSMDLYLRDAPGILEQIATAVVDNDNPALTMSAHTLKGITRYTPQARGIFYATSWK